MYELINRSITAFALIVSAITLFIYADTYIITGILISLCVYVTWFEYRPLYRSTHPTSYVALVMILSGFIALIYINHGDHSSLPLPFFYAMCADTGGYILGQLWGKHRIAPTISPKKSWEGFVGSIICVAVGAIAYISITHNEQAFLHPSSLTLMAFSIVLATVGLLGDLCISQLKRNAGVKDTGTLLPGHGGLLDRLDSVLAIAILITGLLLRGL